MFSYLLELLFPSRNDEAIVRETSQEEVVALLDPLLVEKTTPAATALMPFGDKVVRALIREAKYHESEKAAELLGAVLADYLVELSAETFLKAVLVPLPLSSARRRERGFNQCEKVAEYALRRVAFSGISMDTAILARVKDTEHQTRLSRELRRRNMAGAFAARPALDPALSYIVFDDVVTTGATMQAAIDVLRANGARHVSPLALAH